MEYVLCRKCTHQFDVRMVQKGKLWEYYCGERCCGWYRGNDFWTIAKPCSHYDPIDKQMKLDLDELKGETW